MIGTLSKITIPIALLLFSCNSSKSNEETLPFQEEQTKDTITEHQAESCDQTHLTSCTYIDNSLCENGVCLVCKDPEDHKTILAKDGDKEYDILTYEGLLIGAYSIEGGKRLVFEPYSYYNDDLEMDVPSPYSENLEIDISATQNQYLGYTKTNSATDNDQLF